MSWCGDAGTDLLKAGTLNPCFYNTLAGALLVLVVGVASRQQSRVTQRLLSYRRYLLPQPSTALLGTQLACAAALCLLHALALAYCLDTAAAPFLGFSEALLLLAWLAVAVLLGWSWRAGVTTQLRTFAWAALALYTFGTYSEVQFCKHGLGMSPTQRHVRLAMTAIMQAAVLAFFGCEASKRVPPEERSALQEALLGGEAGAGRDLEAGAAKSRKHSWVQLLGIALAYMWPDSLRLQVRAAVCVLLVLLVRLLNLAVPVLYKRVVDELAYVSERTARGQIFPFTKVFVPWVLAYMVAYFFQGGAGGGVVGLISNLRSYLWIPISQNSYRRASLDVFTHALNMDLNFHLHRKTGELIRIMDRGTNSIQTMLSTVVFSIGPAIFDITAASVYMAMVLKPWIAVIVFVTLSGYIPMTIVLTEWRGKFRRELNRLDNAKGARATDALLNYETVKLFANEELERHNFAEAIDAYQREDYRLSASMNALNVAQSLVIFSGLAAGLVVCTMGVADGSLSVGDAVLFVTLMQQLYAPLNFFGTYYRMIQQAVLDMENMFELLGSHPSVQDAPGAKALAAPERGVAFDGVSFQYNDGTMVLRDVSFEVPPGGTVALVGATGSGKSTCLRLLFRFYDPVTGAVRVGGQDIRDVTQASLRRAVGVVPQDTVLFNDTIRYNIRYGRPSASDAEVEEAAQAACIHETIVTKFPKGYDTIVGERGLRLSGGEKQRVAFARAILKNPPILILDEATSALDSITEKRIQASLAEARNDRTVIIVAHRLSTIMDADAIIVLKEGEVAEAGTHQQLVEQGGLYAEMWRRQQETSAVERVSAPPSEAAASAGPSRSASAGALGGSSQMPAQK